MLHFPCQENDVECKDDSEGVQNLNEVLWKDQNE